VGVVSLVTHGTIEERIVQVMQQKRALFAGLFGSDSDEIDFAALGQPTLIEAVRDVVGEVAAPVAADAAAARAKLAAAGVEFLEALAVVIAAEKPPLAPELIARTGAALQTILDSLRQADDAE